MEQPAKSFRGQGSITVPVEILTGSTSLCLQQGTVTIETEEDLYGCIRVPRGNSSSASSFPYDVRHFAFCRSDKENRSPGGEDAI